MSRIARELQINNEKTSILMRIWEKDVHRQFTPKIKSNYLINIRKWSALPIIKEMQVEATMRYHFTSRRLAKL